MTPHTHFFKGALLGQKVGKIFFSFSWGPSHPK